jgi:hypothetical protein
VIDAEHEETGLIDLREPEPPAPRKKSKATKIALAVLGAAVLALGVTTGPFWYRLMAQKDATLTMPESVGDLKRDDTPMAKEHASDLVAILRAQITDLDSSAGAVYEEPSGDRGRSVMIFGGTATFWNPERELDTVLEFISESGDGGLDGLKKVDPGPLGGVMKCGSTDMETASMAICGWADHGSIAVALFPGRSASDAEGLMRALRAASLKR